MYKGEWYCLVEVVFKHDFSHNFMLKFCSLQISSDGGQHGRLPFFALCLVFQGSPRNVDDSSGRVPLGTAFLPPLPTPGFVFF